MRKTILIILCLSFSICFSQANEKAIEIIQPQVFFLNAAQNIFGNSRQVIPIKLPPKTIKWYYTISAFRNEKDVKEVSNTFNLLANLSKALDATNVSAITLKMLGTPPGSNYCDVFLLTSYSDVNKFESKDDNWGGSFSYIREGSREGIVSGLVDINPRDNSTQYLGFRNKGAFGVNVSLQVVAVVQQDITTNGWTKDQKNKLYEYMKSSLTSSGFNNKINSIQTQDLSVCVVKKMTTIYSPIQFDGLANYEMQEAMMNIFKTCNNDLSLNINFDDIRENSIISKDDFVGKWKDENSVFTLYSTGMISIKWDVGVSKWGNWDFADGILVMKFNGEAKTYNNQVLEFTKDKIVYKEIGSETTYNAVKIGQF